MAKTWDTSRTGGGTYEFTQDAQGNYTLGSVGFDKINKLNLPELKKEATTTTDADTKKTAATVSAQTKQAFGDVQPFYYNQKGEGGEESGTQYTMRREGDLSTETQPMTTGDGPWTMRSGVAEKPGMLGDTGKSIQRDTIPNWAQGADKRGYEKVTTKAEPDRSKAWDKGQWGPQPSNVYRSETEKFKTRFDPTKIKAAAEKPKAAEVVTTQLKKVKTALGPLAKAVGVVMSPVKAATGMLMGMVTDTPMQKHDKQYFNADPQTGRISGNPATDLYAGMNRTSAFGDVGKAGDNRIATRTKTAAKMQGKWSKERMDRFTSNTEKMKGQAIEHKKSQTSVMKNVPPSQRGGGGNDGGGGGRVICTELHRTHELSTKDWIRDTRFTFNTLTENHIKGYLIWAIPTVKYMKKYPKYRKFWKHIAQHRANDIAWRLNEGKFDLLGRIYAGIGEPLCWLIGNFTGNKQINELNITNWRKA